MTYATPSRRLAAAASIAAAVLACAGLGAQQTELAVEVGASQVTPPAGVEGDAGRYLMAGMRFSHYAPVGTGIRASVLAGRSADDATGGNYLSGSLDTRVVKGLGRGWYAGLEARGLGFGVGAPFSYRALAVEGGPTLEYRGRAVTGRVRGVAGTGTSRVDVLTEESRVRGSHHRGDPLTVLVTLDEDLWRYGGEAEFLVGRRTLAAGMAGGVHRTPAGDYRFVGGRLLAGLGDGAMEFRVDSWDTPLGTQATGGLAFVLPVGGWSLRGFFGRSEPDPLTLTEPGRGSGGVLLGRTVAGGGRAALGGTPLYEVQDATGESATVAIEVKAPKAAASVHVLGDFTGWEPVTMTRTDGSWRVLLHVAPGVHHFGFLVDGEWFLPEDAADTVPDEWGRTNATMVIER